ncbi:MAG: hypothetical protein JSR26_03385 [Proteobacteria bacterium]|nr:hypothetical protein [Pseudomonadota bacterium]
MSTLEIWLVSTAIGLSMYGFVWLVGWSNQRQARRHGWQAGAGETIDRFWQGHTINPASGLPMQVNGHFDVMGNPYGFNTHGRHGGMGTSTNPATGLPMLGSRGSGDLGSGFDVAGNPWGSSGNGFGGFP